jgi:flagellar biosynthetic protein FlhB
MPEASDGGSKTEEPTQRKLDEARRRGEVAKSSDVTQWASLAGATGALVAGGGWMASNLAHDLLPFIDHPQAFDLSGVGGVAIMRQAMTAASGPVLAVLGSAMVAGVFGNVIQHGFLFTPDKLAPDFSRLSPAKGFERLFGIDGLVQFLKSGLKIGLVGAVSYWAVMPHARELQNMVGLGPLAVLPLAFDLLRAVFFSVLALLGVGAVLDWIWQRQRFMQRMRMSKEELKEDTRNSEGDPLIKAKIRQIRNERSRKRMMQNVPKATVVVMNPTHYAVALRYVQGETPAPVCMAKGMDDLALKIREVAEEHGIAIVEDPPLARALYATVEVDETIPHEHYTAVAKVVGFVLQQAARRRRRPGRIPS